MEQSTDLDLGAPFRGSLAVAVGAVTADRLRGPGFRRLAPDVHVAASAPVTLREFLEALRLWCPSGVVAGPAAAAVWCRADTGVIPVGERFAWPGVGAIGPVDLVVPGRARPPAGARVSEADLDPDEVDEHAGLRVTSAARTVLDLLRFESRDLAVPVGDAVARRSRVVPADVAELLERRPGSRGLRSARAALRAVDPRSGNVEVSRMRLGLHDLGARPPLVDHVVLRDGWPVAVADLAWPELGCAALCGEREEGESSAVRAAALRSVGWSVWRGAVASARVEAAAVSVAMMLRAGGVRRS